MMRAAQMATLASAFATATSYDLQQKYTQVGQPLVPSFAAVTTNAAAAPARTDAREPTPERPPSSYSCRPTATGSRTQRATGTGGTTTRLQEAGS